MTLGGGGGVREQGWRSGESTRLQPMWPGFDSGREFVVGLHPCSEGFLRVPRFSSLHKTNIFKFEFYLDRCPARKPALAGLAGNSLLLDGQRRITKFTQALMSSSSSIYLVVVREKSIVC